MRLLITGICGFVGSSLAGSFLKHIEGLDLIGIDNLARPGSELNRKRLKSLGVDVRHGDVRQASDLETLPPVDWVLDAAANPSVLAGVDGLASSRQLLEHNLYGTGNTLEYCRRVRAGLVLLSTSRVYSIPALAALPLRVTNDAFTLDESRPLPPGVSAHGLAAEFSNAAPLSLYGSTKLASEILALEYGETFGFPVWINRCGVLAGAGQFGTAEQGIFSYWIHAYAAKRPLAYIGFEGKGWQVRDALHPDDLFDLLLRQLRATGKGPERRFNVGGGSDHALSLAQLTAWCAQRFGPHEVGVNTDERPFDIPWVVMDGRSVKNRFGWAPARTLPSILDEIADHARQHPDWLNHTGAI